jgi:hypothetical protein
MKPAARGGARDNPLIPSDNIGYVRDFRPPPALEADFRKLLEHDINHVNVSFTLIRDWYAPCGGDGASPVIRAQQTPARFFDPDAGDVFKATWDTPIRPGDIVIREDGVLFMLTGAIRRNPNNQGARIVTLNAGLTFTRRQEIQTDERGFVPAGAADTEDACMTVAADMPVRILEGAGRPEYHAVRDAPGVTPDFLTGIALQFNPQTSLIRVNDTFFIGQFGYRVLYVSLTETDIIRAHGVIKLYAGRIAGSER